MAKNYKTKIVRVRSGEMYFERLENFTDAGETRWLVFMKDLTALSPMHRAKKFRDMGYVRKEPIPMDGELLERIVIPANFSTDLIKPFGRLEYAEGHKPAPAFRFC